MSEIMIDGVDVAGCIYYKQECIANCGMFALGDFKCEGQICLYKQLKRLEQENKALKQELLELQKLKDEDSLRVAELATENVKRKTELIGYISHCKYCDEFFMDKCNYIKKENNYRKVLEEIREITKKFYRADLKMVVSGIMVDPLGAVVRIQDKINEVLK